MKKLNSFIFISESNHSKMLSREIITKDVNKVMCCVSKTLSNQPTMISHSFKIDYITQL